MDILSIGEKIRKKRRELGMTMKDLAGNRVTTGQISLIESGKSKPSMDLLEYIAKNLKTSVEYLLESEKKQAIKLCKYYENLAFCNLFKKESKDIEYFLFKMCDLAEKYDLEYIRYKVYFIKGIYMYHLKNYEEATQNILMSNIGFSKLSMNDDIVESFLYLTYISMDCGNYISAIVHLKCIIKMFEKSAFNYNYLCFKVYYLISQSYIKIGNDDLGSYFLDKAMEGLSKVYKPSDNGITFMEKSIEFMRLDDLDNAIKFSSIARKYFEELRDVKDRTDVEIGISKYLSENNILDDCEKYLVRVSSVVESYEFGNIADIYIGFINLYLKKGDIGKVKEYLSRFEKVLDTRNFDDVVEFYDLKYTMFVLEGEYKQAEDTIILLCDFCIDFGEYVKAGNFYLRLYRFYIDSKRFEDAKYVIHRARLQYEKAGYKFVF